MERTLGIGVGFVEGIEDKGDAVGGERAVCADAARLRLTSRTLF